MFYCFFEQSGTFKNEFKKLGYEAKDFDIQNEFNETDEVIDLFKEINNAYEHKPSIFDEITPNDIIIAFFPCIRFEDQIIMGFRGDMSGIKNKWTDEEKLEYDLKLHKELDLMYETITKMAIVSLRKKIPLIIENPSSSQHYLTNYWALKPKVIDRDRRERGDYFIKPTQYWFINCEPKYNMILEPQVWHYHDYKTISNTHNTTERSMISKDYANRFIREFILEENKWK